MSKEIDQKIIEELETLFEFVSPKELSRNIIQIYFSHIGSNQGVFPANFHELSENIYFLLKFLEVVEDNK